MKNRKVISAIVAISMLVGNFASLASYGSQVKNINSATLQKEEVCKIKYENISDYESVNIATSLKISCLEYYLITEENFSKDSKPYLVLQDILNSRSALNLKIDAISQYANRIKNLGLIDELLELKKQLSDLTSNQRNLCATDIKTCDFAIYSLLSLANIFPDLTLKIGMQLKLKIQNITYGIIKDTLEMKLEALIAVSKFYDSTYIGSTGYTPQWRPGVNKTEIVARLAATANNLLSFSQMWSIESLNQFLPNEYREIAKTLPQDKYISELSTTLNKQLAGLGNSLMSLVLYSDRLNNKSPSQWLETNKKSCEQDDMRCTIFLSSLITFLEVEAKLPFRNEYVATLEHLYVVYFMNEQVRQIVSYGKNLAYRVDTVLWEFAKNHQLMNIYANEKKLLNTRGFHSLFSEMGILTGAAVELSVQVKTYEEDQSDQNKALYEAAIQRYESTWFMLQCGLRLSTNTAGQSDLKLPFSNIKLGYQLCGTTNYDLDIRNSFEKEMLRRWVLQPLKDGLVKIGLLATTLVSAFLAGPAGGAITALIAKQIAQNAAKGIVTRIVMQYTQAAISALIFTSSMKVLNAAIGIAPLWNSHQGVYGNFVKPWLIGSVIFFALPYTAAFGAKISDLLIKNSASRNIVNLTRGGIGLSVDTATFMSIEYTHRAIEKLKGERKLIFSGDMDQVFLDNLMFAMAFRVSGHFHSTGVK